MGMRLRKVKQETNDGRNCDLIEIKDEQAVVRPNKIEWARLNNDGQDIPGSMITGTTDIRNNNGPFRGTRFKLQLGIAA